MSPQYVSLTMTSKNVFKQSADNKWLGIRTVDFKQIKQWLFFLIGFITTFIKLILESRLKKKKKKLGRNIKNKYIKKGSSPHWRWKGHLSLGETRNRSHFRMFWSSQSQVWDCLSRDCATFLGSDWCCYPSQFPQFAFPWSHTALPWSVPWFPF